MPRHNRRAHWDHVYTTKNPEEVGWYQARPGTSLEFIERTGLGKEAKIIDLGGGTSRLVDTLLDTGFGRVTVLDISPVALARAKARLGDRAQLVTWIAADVLHWKSPATFDIWHDRAVFHFLIDPEDRAAYREVMAASLGRGGQAIISTFAWDGPERCSGLPVVRYEPEVLARELGPAFRLVESTHEDHLTPFGKDQRFQSCRFVRV